VKEAVEICVRLAEARPDAFLPDLASSLDNLGNRLGTLERHESALAAAERCVAIRRQLACAYPDAFTSDLASSSLNNLGVWLGRLGPR
jgi:Tetratricopeptide repeat